MRCHSATRAAWGAGSTRPPPTPAGGAPKKPAGDGHDLAVPDLEARRAEPRRHSVSLTRLAPRDYPSGEVTDARHADERVVPVGLDHRRRELVVRGDVATGVARPQVHDDHGCL